MFVLCLSLSLAQVECYSEREVAGIVRQLLKGLQVRLASSQTRPLEHCLLFLPQYLHSNDLIHQNLKVRHSVHHRQLSILCMGVYCGASSPTAREPAAVGTRGQAG